MPAPRPVAKEERRRCPRYAVSGVRGWLTFQSEARILNLSLTGMSVETFHHLEVGKEYAVRLLHDEVELRLAGSVVRSRLLGTRRIEGGEALPIYESGIHFEDALGEKGKALERLLGASTEVSLERRITGRFDLGLPESVRLRRDYQFEVLRVSATGMLVAAGLEPRLDSVLELSVEVGGEELTAACRIAFVEQAEDEDGEAERFHLGVEFRDLSAADRRRLEALIAREAGPRAG